MKRLWSGALIVLGLLLLLGLQLGPQLPELLKFSRPAYERGAVWQLFTSQWVHLNWPHTWVNGLVFAASLFGWRTWIGLRDQICALAGGMLGVALVLALDADCAYYAGLSGALHGLWAGNALTLLGQTFMPTDQSKLPQQRMRDVREGTMALLVLLLLVCKLWWQGNAALNPATGWLGIPVYWPAHEAGLAGGLLVMGLVLLLRRTTSGCRD